MRTGDASSGELPRDRDTADFRAKLHADAFLAAIVESSDDAIISEDLQGTITTWNKAAERLFGYSPQEIIGKSVTLIIPSDRQGEEETILERIRRGERVERVEAARRRKDGSLVDISLTVSPINDASGKIIGASKIARDLAEHKRAAETMRSEQRLRLILEGAPNGMVMVNELGEIMMVNAQMERLFGYTRSEMLGQPIEMLLPERYRAAHPGQRQDFFRSPATRAMGHGRDLFARRKDGTEFPVEVGLNPADTPDGRVVLAAVIDITARKKAEEAAVKTATQLRLVVEAAPNGMVMVSERGQIMMVNAQMERLFGYQRSEMIGQPIEMLLPERYRGAHPHQRQDFFHSPTTRAMGHGRDLYARRKDGTEFPVEVGLNPADTPDGRVVLAAVIDITARKKAEEAALKTATQLRLVVEAAPNGMVMVNQRGEIMMVNAQTERLFGYERAEMLGQPVEMLLPERYRGPHPGQRQDFFRSPVTRAMGHGRDLYARRKDGTEFPVEIGLNPADTPDGPVVLAAVIDITARKQAEQALAKSAAQFRLVVESAPNGMVMVDNNGIILMVNSQVERLFGYERFEMIGQPVEMLLPERYRGTHPGQRQSFFRSPLTRAMGHGRDLFARRKDGSEFPVEVGLNPADTPEGPVVLAAIIDITQRKTMEAELAKAHAELSHHARDLEAMVTERTRHLQATIAELEGVSYSLSHDMRAPLRTIQSFSQIVLEEAEAKLEPRQMDLLQKTISAAGRLDRLIQDVLIYSKVARESIALKPIDLEQLLRQIIHERSDLQPPKAQIDIQAPLEPVFGHEAYLTQCITNLLDNAVKFVPPERAPRIRVWNELRDGQVRIWFEDNGIGIPKEAQERIFGMFQRVHADKVYPGTGIGLTIVRKAAERMGGSVGVESEPGKGSRFWLQLRRGDGTS